MVYLGYYLNTKIGLCVYVCNSLTLKPGRVWLKFETQNINLSNIIQVTVRHLGTKGKSLVQNSESLLLITSLLLRHLSKNLPSRSSACQLSCTRSGFSCGSSLRSSSGPCVSHNEYEPRDNIRMSGRNFSIKVSEKIYVYVQNIYLLSTVKCLFTKIFHVFFMFTLFPYKKAHL